MAKSGKPQIHLALLDPAKDRALQHAIKAHRIVTVIQNSTRNAADHGFVGFEEGKNRQFLIFPKSVQHFAGSKIIGIKYGLLEPPELPTGQRAPPPRQRKAKPPSRSGKPKKESGPFVDLKVIPFASEPAQAESPDTADLKKQIRRAMSLLEKGKQVAAFNLLQKALKQSA